MSILTVTIPNEDNFFSLYADGLFMVKHFDPDSGETNIEYEKDSLVYLYYTYPTHRRVYLIRNTQGPSCIRLPNVNKPVKVLFKQFASRVDKTKRAVSYLHTHYQKAFDECDSFFYKLDILLKRKGKLDYLALDSICLKRGA